MFLSSHEFEVFDFVDISKILIFFHKSSVLKSENQFHGLNPKNNAAKYQ